MKIDVDEGIAKEFAYIVELHKNCGADNPQESVESLIERRGNTHRLEGMG